MKIDRVRLSDVRSYRTLTLHPEPGLNLLVGPNGQGKTNLLEALGILITGRSFRTSRLAEVPRWGADSATISGDLVRGEGGRENRRTTRRLLVRAGDGRWQTTGDIVPEWARAIAFGWQDIEIVSGGPAERRRLVDGFAARLNPAHVATLLRYRQLLERRNRILQRHRLDADLDGRLAPWSEQLAIVGMELIARRRRAVAVLQTELARVWAALAGTRTKVEIRYRTGLGEATAPAALLAAMEHERRREVRLGQTVVGPHRDDLAIEIDGSDARTFASRGQQRLVALAMRLAEVTPVAEAAGTAPVLLLDDALSEFDPGVRGEVLQELRGAGQIFLTAPEPLMATRATVFHVNGGGVAAA